MRSKPSSLVTFSWLQWSGWNSRSAYAVLTGLLISGITIFFCITLREGQNWDGDYALYIMNARNIITGRPYADTGYLFNPKNPIHPASYPPGLALLLAPLYLWSGIDLQQMKMVGVSAFILFLLVFSRIVRQFLPAGIALAVTAVVGLHPVFWQFKDMIYSDLPFLFFCYAALYLVESLHQSHRAPQQWAIVGAALALALAYMTRTIGIILFPTIALMSLYRSKKLINSGALIIALAALIIIFGRLRFPNDVATYAGYFEGYNLLAVAQQQNTPGFMEGMRALVISKVFHGARLGPYRLNADGVVVAFLLLVLLGWIIRVRARFSIYELFLLAYGLMFLAFPLVYASEFTRYSLPMWPLLILYAFYGVYTTIGLLGKTAQLTLPVLLFAAVCSVFAMQYRKTNFGPIPRSVTDPSSRELFDTIKTAVPTDAVLLARKPTIIALFTDRRSAIWPAKFSDEELWRYMHEIGASYIVEDPLRFGVTHDPPEDELHAFIERNQSALTRIFANSWFNLYEVSGSPHPPSK